MASLLIFGKVPGLAGAKTRLRPELGSDGANQVAEALLADAISLVNSVACANRVFASQPEIAFSDLLTRLAHLKISKQAPSSKMPCYKMITQRGDSFGQRLQNALVDTFAAFGEGVLVIGTDSPLLSAETISRALTLVSQGNFVLGPTPEGGVYAIGVPQTLLESNIDLSGAFGLSGSTELEELCEIACQENVSLELLELNFDIDIPQDLITLRSMLAAMQTSKSLASEIATNTRAWLERVTLGTTASNENNREFRTIAVKS